MGLSFTEAMQGSLVDRWGRTTPVDFAVKAEATHWTEFLRTGRARLTGVVHAPPWGQEAAVDGAVTIRPLPGQGRFIRYEIGFAGADGRRYALFGQKDLSLLSPTKTISTMRARLSCDGEEIARGQMRYDLNDVVRFAAAARPVARIPQVNLAEATPEGDFVAPPLGPHDVDLLRAFCDAFIEPGVLVPAADEDTVQRALSILARMPAGASTAYAAVLRGLDALALARHGRGFAALDRPARVALLSAVEQTPGAGALGGPLSPNAIVHLVGMPVRAAHFDRPSYLAAIGARTYDNPVREPDPEWTQRICRAEDLDAESEVEADVVVVGTGAGGGPVAARLAEKGLAVAVLEEGRYHGRREFHGSPVQRMQRFWRDAGMTFSTGNTPISIPMGKLVGGTTAINSGTCFRTPAGVFDQWRAELGLPDEFSAGGFDRWYAQVEAELQVTPADRRVLGKIAGVVAQGADAMGLDHAPLPRNAPGCDGQGVCMVGCPTDAKRASQVSWVPRAVNAGAQLFTGLPVTRILMRHGRAVGVEARGSDAFGAPKVLRVRARAVVIATGTLLTPGLLADNGLEHPWLGRNLSVHPELGMWVRCAQRMDGWNAIPQSYGVSSLEAEGIKFEGYFVPPQLAAATIPLMGHELTRWMDAQAHVGQFGFMVRDGGDGSVHRGPDGRPFVRYDLSERSRQLMHRGAAVLAEMLVRGGGEEVLTGIRFQPTIRTVAEARALLDRPIRPLDLTILGSHPLGTARIGADPRTAVCDPDHRVWGTTNVYVVDGSAVPSSLGVNPQMTIMAMALRAAESLATALA